MNIKQVKVALDGLLGMKGRSASKKHDLPLSDVYAIFKLARDMRDDILEYYYANGRNPDAVVDRFAYRECVKAFIRRNVMARRPDSTPADPMAGVTSLKRRGSGGETLRRFHPTCEG